MLTVRKAEEADFGRILEIYAHARKFMAEHGNPTQWGTQAPRAEVLREDLQVGRLYVVTDDAGIHGVFTFFSEPDPTYAYIEGSWCSDTPYDTIHRVAGDGSGGVFRACMSYCKARSAHLRMDTHADNKIMQHLIESAGFSRRGIIYVSNGSPRIAYEFL